MDLIDPTSVVLPDIPSTDGLGIKTRGVLQERSGNRQVDRPSYPPLEDTAPSYRALNAQLDTKYDIDGGKYEYILQEQQPPTLEGHSPYPLAHALPLSMDEEQRITQLTHEICTRAMSYEPYSAYRDNQRKRSANGSKGGDVWTDQEELAFWRGIVLYPPCGRKQQYYRARPTKPMGRNELLAAVVADFTGEHRHRKQLSSHLQVVRQKLGADPWLVAQLISSDKKTRSQTERRERTSRASHRRESRRSHPPNQNASRHHHASPAGVLPLHTAVPNPWSIARFDLYISDTRKQPPLKCQITCMVDHKHASHQSSQLPDQRIDDFSSEFLLHFPQIEAQWRDGTLQDTQLVFANVTLDLDVLQNLELGGTEIGIDYHLRPDSSWDTRNFKQLFCSTTFYERDQAVDIDADRTLCEDVNYQTIIAPFSSKFWVPKIKGISLDLQRAREERKRATQPTLSTQAMANAERLAKKWEYDAAERVANLTAVQEFSGTLIDEPKREKRVLIVCWSFEQATNGRDGTMMWWNGILPFTAADHRHYAAMDQELLPQDHPIHPNSALSIQTHMTLPDLTDGESFSAPQSAGFGDERSLNASHHMPGFQGLGVLRLPDHVGIATDAPHNLYSTHSLEQNPLDLIGTEGSAELCMDGAPPVLGSLAARSLAATADMGFPPHGYPCTSAQLAAHHQTMYDQSWMHGSGQDTWTYHPVESHQLLDVHHMEGMPSRPQQQHLQLEPPAEPQPYIGPYLQPSPFEDITVLKHVGSFQAPSIARPFFQAPTNELDIEPEMHESHLQATNIHLTDEEQETQAGADAATGLKRDISNLDMLSQELAR